MSEVSEAVDLWGMLQALKVIAREERPNRADGMISDTDRALNQAMGYVWGREDSGEASVRIAYGREVNAYHEFAYMYAIMSLLCDMERIHSKNSIRDAFAAFKAGVDLREYVYTR